MRLGIILHRTHRIERRSHDCCLADTYTLIFKVDCDFEFLAAFGIDKSYTGILESDRIFCILIFYRVLPGIQNAGKRSKAVIHIQINSRYSYRYSALLKRLPGIDQRTIKPNGDTGRRHPRNTKIDAVARFYRHIAGLIHDICVSEIYIGGFICRIGAQIFIYRLKIGTAGHNFSEGHTAGTIAHINRTGKHIPYSLLVINRCYISRTGKLNSGRYSRTKRSGNLGQRIAARSSTVIYGRDERVGLTGSKKPALLQREGVIFGRKLFGAAFVTGCHRDMVFELLRLHARFQADIRIIQLYRKRRIFPGILRHCLGNRRAQRQDEQYCGTYKDDGTQNAKQQFSFGVHKKPPLTYNARKLSAVSSSGQTKNQLRLFRQAAFKTACRQNTHISIIHVLICWPIDIVYARSRSY